MGRYRRKPWIVDAWRFTSPDALAPSFVTDALKMGVLFWQGGDDPHFTIDAPTGGIKVWLSEWIIREPDGTFARAAPAIFTALYEPADAATSIARNQIVTPQQLPGAGEHTLERVDDAEAQDYAGPPVVIAPYRRPADKRVKELISAAERERAALARSDDAPAPRKTFSDPRLDPNYKPPKRLR